MKLHYFLDLVSQNYLFKGVACYIDLDNFKKHLFIGHCVVLFLYKINHVKSSILTTMVLY